LARAVGGPPHYFPRTRRAMNRRCRLLNLRCAAPEAAFFVPRPTRRPIERSADTARRTRCDLKSMTKPCRRQHMRCIPLRRSPRTVLPFPPRLPAGGRARRPGTYHCIELVASRRSNIRHIVLVAAGTRLPERGKGWSSTKEPVGQPRVFDDGAACFWSGRPQVFNRRVNMNSATTPSGPTTALVGAASPTGTFRGRVAGARDAQPEHPSGRSVKA